ncbi:MAG TPA: TolC family protein [Bdellovibrionota bacterium]|nr:TolC family protein [Bdellovibrionota bacterium]
MSHGIKASIAVLLLLSCPAPAAASEKTKLPLSRAIEISLEKNLDLKIALAGTRESAGYLMRSEGEFDWDLKSSLSRDYNTTPTASTLDGVDEDNSLKTNKNALGFGFNKKFAFGPKLGINYSQNVSGSNSSYATTNPLYSANVAGSFEVSVLKLLTPSWFRRSLDESEQDWRIAETRHGEKLVDTVQKTIDLYFDCKQAEQEFRVQTEIHKIALENLEFVQRKRSAGLASKIDLLDAVVAEKRADEGRLRAQETLSRSTDELNAHILGDLGQEFELEGDLTAEAEKSLPEMPAAALDERPDLQRSRHELTKAEIGERGASRELYPDFNAKANVTYAGIGRDLTEAQEPLKEFANRSYSASLTASMPLFRWTARGTHKSAQAKLEAQSLRNLQLKRNIEIELRSSLRRFESAGKRVEALKRAIESETESFAAKKAFLRAGRIGVAELNRSMDSLLHAELELVKATVSRVKARYAATKAGGVLLKEIRN